ncbi:hypothetical protein H6P81_011113 [Aristolochia fimbriata]|uniref:Uncharacterized protein n=1 Tax=Aristolochia fimbriata TaxID=158543 RepID=A0AAV7EQK9_ARIFI|nr:hypothetical protein H6P81_011113 [Aristolochia fimbriata]
MIHPRRGYGTGGEAVPADWVRKTNGHGNRGGSGFMEAATPPRRAFGGFGNHLGGHGIEFGSRPYPEEEMGASSPPLWRRSPPGSASPIHRGFSPNSRLQAITRGQQELMEMVENMPESSYELSLRDMVEAPKSTVNPLLQRGQPAAAAAAGGPSEKKKQGKKQIKRTKSDKKKDARSGYVGNGDFLLRMFMPASLKKSGSGKGRVSPVKSPEGEWWKKRSSAVGEAEKSGRTSRSGSTSSSSSSSTSRRHMSGALPGCWFFLHGHKGKPRKHKEGGLA